MTWIDRVTSRSDRARFSHCERAPFRMRVSDGFCCPGIAATTKRHLVVGTVMSRGALAAASPLFDPVVATDQLSLCTRRSGDSLTDMVGTKLFSRAQASVEIFFALRNICTEVLARVPAWAVPPESEKHLKVSPGAPSPPDQGVASQLFLTAYLAATTCCSRQRKSPLVESAQRIQATSTPHPSRFRSAKLRSLACSFSWGGLSAPSSLFCIPHTGVPQ